MNKQLELQEVLDRLKTLGKEIGTDDPYLGRPLLLMAAALQSLELDYPEPAREIAGFFEAFWLHYLPKMNAHMESKLGGLLN